VNRHFLQIDQINKKTMEDSGLPKYDRLRLKSFL
jgi:hypothetical protein